MTTFLTAQSLEDLEQTKKRDSLRKTPPNAASGEHDHRSTMSGTLALRKSSTESVHQGETIQIRRRSKGSRGTQVVSGVLKDSKIHRPSMHVGDAPAAKMEPDKHLQRACFLPEDLGYYKGLSVKPAFDWFRGLTARDPRAAASALALLEVPIADMFCFFGIRRYWIKNIHPSGRGGIEFLADNDFDKSDIIQESEKWCREAAQVPPGNWQGTAPPVVVQKISAKVNSNKSTMLDEANVQLAMQRDPSADDATIYQRYIRPRAGAKACIYRVAWRDTMGPWGFCLTNNSTAEEVRAGGGDLSAQWTVSMDRPQSLHAFDLRTVPPEAAQIAERVAKFTQNYFKMRMKQLVVDLVQDRDGRFYFLQVKAFTLYDPELAFKNIANAQVGGGTNRKQLTGGRSLSTLLDWRRGTHDFKGDVAKLQLQDSAALESLCKMCQCSYPVAKLKKKMTLKMMLETEHHLRKRGLELFHVKRPKQEKLTQQYNVCELCWSLYRAEAELQRTEMKVAHAVHIDVRECQEDEAYVPFAGVLDAVQSANRPIDYSGSLKRRDVLHVSDPVPPQPLALTHSASAPALLSSGDSKAQASGPLQNTRGGEALQYTDPLREDCVLTPVPEVLTQWRMMVHFHSLTDVSDSIQILSSQTKLKLQLVVPWKKEEPLDLELNSFEASHIHLRRTTLHFLFTDPHESHPLQNVLQEGTLQFRLLAQNREVDPAEFVIPGALRASSSTGALNVKKQRQQEWSELLTGSCSLKQMLENREDFRAQMLLMLFSRDYGSCHLKVTLGLKKDHPISTQYTMLRPITQAWVPTRPYFTSDPLPVTWIDCIVGGSRDAFEAAAQSGRCWTDEHRKRKGSADDLKAAAAKAAREGRHAPGLTIMSSNGGGAPLTGPIFLAPRPTEVVPAGCGHGKTARRPALPRPRSQPHMGRSHSTLDLRDLRERRTMRPRNKALEEDQGASSSAESSTRPPSASTTYTAGSRPNSAALVSRPQSAGPSRPASASTLPSRPQSAGPLRSARAPTNGSVGSAVKLYSTPQATTSFRGREQTYVQPAPGRPSSAQAPRERPSSASRALPARPSSVPPQRRSESEREAASAPAPAPTTAQREQNSGLSDTELARIEMHLDRLRQELYMHQSEINEL